MEAIKLSEVMKLSSKTKKIAIVGSAPGSEMLAPFNDSQWEIWALGQHVKKYPRVTKAFEIHEDLADSYQQYLKTLTCPLIVGANSPIKGDNVTVFPFDKTKEIFGYQYLTSSIAYMVAMAYLEGATHVSIYGVDMAVDDNEYFYQQSCVTAWIGFLKGKGIDVYLPENSSLLKSKYVYGSEASDVSELALPPFTSQGFKKLEDQHQDRINKIRQQIASLEQQLIGHEGARQSYERMAKVARAVEAGQVITALENTAIIR